MRHFSSLKDKRRFVSSVKAVDNKLVASLEEPEEQNPTIVRALVEAGAEIQFVGELRRSLEDVYLELIGDDRSGN